MNAKLNQMTLLMLVIISILTSGCSALFDKELEWGYVEPESYPVLKAIGYAPIAAQLSDSDTGKMLQAMKASKLDAYRELTEQVYGQKIDGNTSVEQWIVQDSQVDATVRGVIRGAKVVRQYPVGDDLYATELSLDMAVVHDLYLSVAKPKQLKRVTFH